ncbi:hypothetical protein PMAYCL1PPCAC_08230, partial [Pristionchus mayeri]
NTACGVIPPCTVISTILSFYFDVTPDRLSCRRLFVCPGDWFDVNKVKRADEAQLQQSRELYNILAGKMIPHHNRESKNEVDKTVL